MPQSKYRSVNDYESSSKLLRSLLVGDDEASADWVVDTQPLSIKEEMGRLLNLQSYLALDAEREPVFERFTRIAARTFDVPVALLTLIDMGREFIMSSYGFPPVKEVPRQQAICAHTILMKDGVLIVPDLTKDERFNELKCVASAPHVRFYAGAALKTPEGYHIGTLCLVDYKPRPPISDDQLESLKDLAYTVVDLMVSRRERLSSKVTTGPCMASVAHELITPLSALQMSLSLLQEDRLDSNDPEFKQQRRELLSTATKSSEIMLRVCRKLAPETPSSASSLPTNKEGTGKDEEQVTVLSDTVRNLYTVCNPLPKTVPIMIQLGKELPKAVLGDDLVIFRCAMVLLTSALDRAQSGCIILRILRRSDRLVIECQDSACLPDSIDRQALFQPCTAEDGNFLIGLYSVACLVGSIEGGDCGYYPRQADSTRRRDNTDAKKGSVFWFSMPLLEHEIESCLQGNQLQRELQQQLQRPLVARFSGLRFSSTGETKRYSAQNFSQEHCGIPGFSLDYCGNLDFSVPPAVPDKMPSAVSALSASTRTPRALVIDDSAATRKLLQKAMERIGFEVILAVDGMDGLEKLKQGLFDVTLCDFLMPKMDGMDCVRHYRKWETAHRPSFRQYIVGMSAHVREETARDQGSRMGMDGFKSKPITLKTLEEIKDSKTFVEHYKALSKKLGVAKPASGNSSSDSDSDLDFAKKATAKKARDAFAKAISSLPAHIKKRPASMSTMDELIRQSPKKSRLEPPTKIRACLIATDRGTTVSDAVLSSLESQGWTVEVVTDSAATCKALEERNWNAVLIDDSLPAMDVISRFRTFEAQNRIHRQSNVMLIIDEDIPSACAVSENCVLVAPCGFDGVVGHPLDLDNLLHVIGPSLNKTCSQEMIAQEIVSC